MTGCKLVLSHLGVWGYPTYVKYLKIDKLRSRSNKYLFIGYPKETRGYYFYLTKEQEVFVSNRTIFLKKKFFEKETNAIKVELDKVR